MSKYDVDTVEARYQPGSDEQVLLNRLGITDPEEMDNVEAHLLSLLYKKVFSDDEADSNFSFDSILHWHKQWLGRVYDWAGKVRSVRLSKDGFEFRAPPYIDQGIVSFEEQYLTKLPYLSNFSREELVSYLAKSHVDLIQHFWTPH